MASPILCLETVAMLLPGTTCLRRSCWLQIDY